MESIKKKYIVNEKNKKIAVQVDLKTFEKIEEIMENHGLYKLIEEEDIDKKKMTVDEAKSFYSTLRKAK